MNLKAKPYIVQRVKGNIVLLQKQNGKASFMANIHEEIPNNAIATGDVGLVRFNGNIPTIFGIMKGEIA